MGLIRNARNGRDERRFSTLQWNTWMKAVPPHGAAMPGKREESVRSICVSARREASITSQPSGQAAILDAALVEDAVAHAPLAPARPVFPRKAIPGHWSRGWKNRRGLHRARPRPASRTPRRNPSARGPAPRESTGTRWRLKGAPAVSAVHGQGKGNILPVIHNAAARPAADKMQLLSGENPPGPCPPRQNSRTSRPAPPTGISAERGIPPTPAGPHPQPWLPLRF